MTYRARERTNTKISLQHRSMSCGWCTCEEKVLLRKNRNGRTFCLRRIEAEKAESRWSG